MYDTIEKIGRSVVQRGPNNDRIYLMKLHTDDLPTITDDLLDMARRYGYSKIFTKVPAYAVGKFMAAGFEREASIPGFYNGREDAFFLSRFMSAERKKTSEKDMEAIQLNVSIAALKKDDYPEIQLPANIQMRALDAPDAPELARLYKKVFQRYPFPVFEEDYLRATMKENVRYYGAFLDGQLVAASSAEMDIAGANAEMTDFAADPEFRGRNLSLVLLDRMEQDMKKMEFRTLYTIARSFSTGMNVTFARQGYHFAGTLINNTNIAERIESMNVWYKSL